MLENFHVSMLMMKVIIEKAEMWIVVTRLQQTLNLSKISAVIVKMAPQAQQRPMHVTATMLPGVIEKYFNLCDKNY